MSITTSGIFSGINTDDVVAKLMQVESRPLVALQRKEADYQAKISGLGSLLSTITGLKSSLTALKDSSNLISMKAMSSDTNTFTAITTTGALAANHSIKVNNIATNQSVYSAAFTNTTDAVADLSTYATQKLQIQVGSSAAVITVDSTNNTLSGIMSAINNAKIGVNASIVNDGTAGNRLVLTSTTPGAANRITVKADIDNNGIYEEAPLETNNTGLARLAFNPTYNPDGTVLGGIVNMTQSQAAKDASLVVDGLAITKSSNTISDVIAGVTINLVKDSAGSTLNLNVSQDNEAIRAKLTAFVTAYNSAMSSIKGLQGTKDKKGVLPADSTMDALANTLRNVISNTYSNSSLTLLGITHDKYGVVSLDSTTFDKAMTSGSQSVANVVNAMATSLDSTIDNYIKNVIPNKQDSYSKVTKSLAKAELDMQIRLSKTELDLKRKFNNLDRLMGQLQNQSNYMTQQLAALNKQG